MSSLPTNDINEKYYDHNHISNNTNFYLTYHEKYISLLFILFFCFGFLAYFLFNLSKKFLINGEKFFDSKAISQKYSITKNLAIACLLRCASITYIIICENKTGYDILSFFNYLCHLIPSFIFITIFYYYIQFLIEKYYEMLTKKNQIFFAPTIQFFLYLIFAIVSLIGIACLSTRKFKVFYYMSDCILCILCMILGTIYLIYGCKIAGYYSNYTYLDSQEKFLIYQRILLISSIVGCTHLIRGFINFFISIGWFKEIYPTFMEVNIWDFLVFFTCECISSLVIGFSKKDKRRDFVDSDIENFEFSSSSNNKNFSKVRIGSLSDKSSRKDAFVSDLEDPLLNKFENEKKF